MDFYSYLLNEMGFDVDPTAYFLVCNANRGADGFFGKMDFSETLIPYQWSIDWIRSSTKHDRCDEYSNSIQTQVAKIAHTQNSVRCFRDCKFYSRRV